MGRPPKAGTSTVEYKGVVISLYSNSRGTWESSYTIPGFDRDKAYGQTQAKCQENAQDKISDALGAEERAFRGDVDRARTILSEHKVSLTEAARYWVDQHSKVLKKATIKELRNIWLNHRKNQKGDKRYHFVRSLRSRSKHMEDAMGDKQLAAISLADLVEWQDQLELKYEPRTVRNIHDACKDMWKFGRKRNYLDPERLSVMERMDRPSAGTAKREIYSPDELQRLLDAAWATASRGAVAIAIGAFGYIRTEEMCGHDPDQPLHERLAWEDFRWEKDEIFIREEVAKTGETRFAGLSPNLKQMLYPMKGQGAVYPHPRLDATYAKIAKAAKQPWKYNALRHSCLTYAMLLAPNATEVATKAGNSVQIIESNYRNRGATIEDAKKWFSLQPQKKWGSQQDDELSPDD